MGGEKGTPGNYCLRMRVIKRLLRKTTAVTNNGFGFGSDVNI